jgi:hypothetical protein
MHQEQPAETNLIEPNENGEATEQLKVIIDRSLPFVTRWEQFLADQKFASIYRYFDLPKDKNFLKKYIFADQNKAEIIHAIPTGKTSWRRFKTGCLEMLSLKP